MTHLKVAFPVLSGEKKFYPVQRAVFNGECYQWEIVDYFESKQDAERHVHESLEAAKKLTEGNQ